MKLLSNDDIWNDKKNIDMNRYIVFIRLIGMLDENALACDSLPNKNKDRYKWLENIIFYLLLIYISMLKNSFHSPCHRLFSERDFSIPFMLKSCSFFLIIYSLGFAVWIEWSSNAWFVGAVGFFSSIRLKSVFKILLCTFGNTQFEHETNRVNCPWN